MDVLFVVLPEVNLLDLSGPAQVFSAAAALGADYRLRWVAAEDGVVSAQGLALAGLGWEMQVVIFAILSGLSLILWHQVGRKLMRRAPSTKLNRRGEQLIGRTVVLTEAIANLKRAQFNLRFRKASGQLEATGRIQVVRRDIARIKTLLGERSRAASQAK